MRVPHWNLRPAQPTDRGFLFNLNRAAMREYVERTWGWRDDEQVAFFDEHFEPDRWQIIQAEGVDVGMLVVEVHPDEINLAEIQLLPEWQGRGIGSAVVRAIMEKGAAAGIPVTLRVLHVNSRARALYERLGFATFKEIETHTYLRWSGTSRTPPRAYRGRQPSAPMEAREVVRLLNLLEADGVTVWIDGGWGVDALLERQERMHDDLDLVIELADVPQVTAVLKGAGYEVVAGKAPNSFVAVDAAGRQVDIHPVSFDDARGGGVYQMDDGREWVYPSVGFAGRGSVAGRSVRCLSADVQVLVHDGYELTDKDYRELYLLHERFGVELPAKYAKQALAARDA